MDNKNYKNKYLEFFSSRLGLFILTGVFLTLVPFLYTNYNSWKINNTEKSQKIEKLISEINHRLITVNTLTNDILRPYEIKDIRLANFGYYEELEPMYYNFRPVFIEFSEQSLLSLIIQLNSLTSDKNKIIANRDLKESVKQIKIYIDELVLTESNRTKIDLPYEKWTYDYGFPDDRNKEIEQTLIQPIEKWRKIWAKF